MALFFYFQNVSFKNGNGICSEKVKLTFLRNLCIIDTRDVILYVEVPKMKKGSKLALFIGIIAAIAAIVSAAAAVLMYLDKKKNDEDLEHYLDCSIQ